VSRIGLVAPVQAVRAGLNVMLEAAGLELVWQAASLAEIEPHLETCDVLVVSASGVSRDELSQTLQNLEGQLGLLLLVDRPPEIPELAGLGLRAWGVLPLEASEVGLAAAVRALEAGLIVSTPGLGGITPGRNPGGETTEGPLTDRELEVLQHLAQGLANKQIGLALGISEHTVKFHVASIYNKLGAANRAEAVRLGVQKGLVAL